MIGGMDFVADALGGHRIFVQLADLGPDALAVAEVLVQEGLTAWTLPASDVGAIRDAASIFGRRARVGAHGATTPEQVASAFDAGARFVTSPVCFGDLVAAAQGRPLLPGALTPSEVVWATHAGASAVQVVPADSMGTSYSRSLLALVSGVQIVATGGLERFQAEMWLEAGAVAVGLTGLTTTGDVDLDDVRRRAQTFDRLVSGN